MWHSQVQICNVAMLVFARVLNLVGMEKIVPGVHPPPSHAICQTGIQQHAIFGAVKIHVNNIRENYRYHNLLYFIKFNYNQHVFRAGYYIFTLSQQTSRSVCRDQIQLCTRILHLLMHGYSHSRDKIPPDLSVCHLPYAMHRRGQLF
jgi:hypothetical protein